MAALTEDRNTPAREGDILSLGVLAATEIFAGSIACRDATGFAVPGATSTTLKALGRAEEHVDNSDGADGDESVTIRRGVFKFGNSAAADEIVAADIGNTCFIVDDQTVAKTDGTSTRSAAGRVIDVDSNGVWVEIGAQIA